MSKKSKMITLEFPLDRIVSDFEACSETFDIPFNKEKFIKLLTTSESFKKKFVNDVMETWSITNDDGGDQLLECYEDVFEMDKEEC